MKTDTATAIRKALDALGTTAEAIRASLKRRRIKGKPCYITGCPLAVYLRRKVDVTIIVAHDHATPLAGLAYRPLCKLRRHEKAFVRAFDAGKYPDLVKPEPVGP